MSALDELLKEIPSDYDAVDAANHLIHFRDDAINELATLRAQLAEAREANDRLVWRMKWISDNLGDGIALRFAFKATDEEVDDIRSKE